MIKIAKINQNNIVEQVLILSEQNSLDENGNLSIDVGINYLKNIHEDGENYIWIYVDPNKHKCIPSSNWVYHSDEDCFRQVKPTDVNHTLVYDEGECNWTFPIPFESNELPPPDGFQYEWDEDLYQSDNTKGWVLVEIPEEPQDPVEQVD